MYPSNVQTCTSGYTKVKCVYIGGIDETMKSLNGTHFVRGQLNYVVSSFSLYTLFELFC